MNPNRDRGGAPQFDAVPNMVEGTEESGHLLEVAPSRQEAAPSLQPTVPAIKPSSTLLTSPVNITDDNNQIVASTQTPSSSPADDTDRIEKQWIERAKAIVAQTKDDPRKQKDEMSKVKADYIQKRFNKTIKTADSSVA